ncbi:unnamed protein product, partial [Symbiodinium pilosum]
MNAVFQDSQLRPLDKVIRLSRDSINELQSLLWLAPLFVSDLRCSCVPSLFALDASPFASGMVSAPLAESIVAELWRHGEQRGYYTRLESPATATLRELGLETEAAFGAAPVDHPSLDVPVPASLREGFLFDCVELFSGETHWTDAHARAGLHCHAGFDTSHPRRRFSDLSDRAVFSEVLALAARRVVREWRCGPPCLTFGTLRRPRIRSKLYPSGFNPDDPLTALRNLLARRVAFLCCIIALTGQFFSIEQMAAGSLQHKNGIQQSIPLSARLSSLEEVDSELALELPPGFDEITADSREFFDDPEWIGELADSLPFKELLRYRFSRPGHINVLETRTFKSWLKWCAKRHPNSRMLALMDSRVLLGASSKGRSSSPALSRVLRSSVPYILGGRLYPAGLHVYSAKNRSDGPPAGLPSQGLPRLSRFGSRTFAKAGLPRYLLVYAITAVQDSHPHLRNQLTPAWQIDKKWQQAEPGECRPVISKPVLLAAVSVAILWNWHDWAAITLIGFLCMLHPSEFIALTRGDLILPSDALSSDRVAYVYIRNPKTARFARRQHCRLEDSLTLSFLEALFTHVPLDQKLFRASMSAYRNEWNAVMARLEVPHTLAQRGATPGVLRGSGATFLYLEAEDLPLVAWRGRWARTKTVEFYLQE